MTFLEANLFAPILGRWFEPWGVLVGITSSSGVCGFVFRNWDDEFTIIPVELGDSEAV